MYVKIYDVNNMTETLKKHKKVIVRLVIVCVVLIVVVGLILLVLWLSGTFDKSHDIALRPTDEFGLKAIPCDSQSGINTFKRQEIIVPSTDPWRDSSGEIVYANANN